MIIREPWGEFYECARAEQHGDKLHLFNEDGTILVILDESCKISSVEDGEIVVVEAPVPTATDDIMALLVDQEYRLTLLELGLVE